MFWEYALHYVCGCREVWFPYEFCTTTRGRLRKNIFTVEISERKVCTAVRITLRKILAYSLGKAKRKLKHEDQLDVRRLSSKLS